MIHGQAGGAHLSILAFPDSILAKLAASTFYGKDLPPVSHVMENNVLVTHFEN
jgi:hypothetical protein